MVTVGYLQHFYMARIFNTIVYIASLCSACRQQTYSATATQDDIVQVLLYPLVLNNFFILRYWERLTSIRRFICIVSPLVLLRMNSIIQTIIHIAAFLSICAVTIKHLIECREFTRAYNIMSIFVIFCVLEILYIATLISTNVYYVSYLTCEYLLIDFIQYPFWHHTLPVQPETRKLKFY
jgi:hypothetical protein